MKLDSFSSKFLILNPSALKRNIQRKKSIKIAGDQVPYFFSLDDKIDRRATCSLRHSGWKKHELKIITRASQQHYAKLAVVLTIPYVSRSRFIS